MLLVSGQAGLHGVRPAYPLQPGRDLRVIQIEVITAVVADELERAGVATLRPSLRPSLRPPGGLAPQAGRKPVTELTQAKD